VLKSKLNNHELSNITDKLVWDKHLLIKTVKLINKDLETV